MKFWNKNYNELTVKELSILAVVMGLIAGVIGTIITYLCYVTDFFETVSEKITGIWNKIFHK